MASNESISQFFWFMAIVEDRQDPLQMGRVRVRTLEQTKDKTILPTSDLPWAQVVVNNSASMGDVGVSATGYVEGSLVVGFYIDGAQKQKPMIIGSIPGFPQERGDKNVGHSDPRGVYPKETRRPDVNALARTRTMEDTGDKKHPSIELREKQADDLTGEPIPERKTVYPYASVMETESGHIQEFDDTLGYERICTMHRSGTMYEMHASGDMVTHVVKDNYSVIMGSDNVRVRGDVKVYVDGDSYVYVRGDADMQVGGDFQHNVKGDYTLDVGGNMSITTNGFYHLEADDEIFNITNANYFLNAETGITASTSAKTFLHSKDTFDINTNSKFTLKSKNTEINAKGTDTNEGITLYAQRDIDLHANEQLFMQADIDIDMNAGNDIFLKAYSDIWHKSNKFRTRYVLDGEFVRISRDEIGNLPAFDAKSTDSISITPAAAALIYNPQPLTPLTNFIYDKELKITERGNLNLFGLTGAELFTEFGTGGAVKTVTNNDGARNVGAITSGINGAPSTSDRKNVIPAGGKTITGANGTKRTNPNYHVDNEQSSESEEIITDVPPLDLKRKDRPHINTLDAIDQVKSIPFRQELLKNPKYQNLIIYKNDIWDEAGTNYDNRTVGTRYMWEYIGMPDYADTKTYWCVGFAVFILMYSGNATGIGGTAGSSVLLDRARKNKLGKIIFDRNKMNNIPIESLKKGDLIIIRYRDSSGGHATFFDGKTATSEKLSGIGGNQSSRVKSSNYNHYDIQAIVRPKSYKTGEDQPAPGLAGAKISTEEPSKQTEPRAKSGRRPDRANPFGGV